MEEKIKKFFKVINLILTQLEKTSRNLEKLIKVLVSLAGWTTIMIRNTKIVII